MRFPDDVPVLDDGVVRLRAHGQQDLDAVAEQGNDPQSVAWTTVPQPYGRREAVEWVETAIPRGWTDESDLCFAVEYDGRFAGSINLRPRSGAEAEVGYGLHPAVRGIGVMHRSLGLLLDWAFRERKHRVVTWRANVGNWASRRVAWAAGFRFGPTVPQMLVQRGRTYDAWTGWIGVDDSRRPKSRWLEVPVLETDRLRLRAWGERDADRLVETGGDDLLRRFIPHSPLPRRRADVASYLLRVQEQAAEGTRLPWCVADRRTDEALGNVALFEFQPDASAQLGYWAHPRARGRGLLSEASRRVADWALAPQPDGFGLRRLYLLTAAGNTASRRVAEHAGFVHVGTERASATVGDGYDDNAVYDRLA